MCEDGKQCTKCLETKRLVDFPVDRKRKDGRGYWCSECANAYKRSNLHRRRDSELNAKEKQRLKDEKRQEVLQASLDKIKNGTKVCSKCKVEQSLDEFTKDKICTDGYRPSCRSCMQTYVYENSEYIKERAIRLYHKTKEANRPAVIARNNARKAKQLTAIPKWANLDEISKIYKERSRVSKETGVIHHVDHTIPLISKLVCGLHCEANLRIITKDENLKKKNIYWPDMPT